MTTPVRRDARVRALRTAAQGLAFSVAAAFVVALLAAVTTATSWTDLGAALVAFSFFQSIAVAGLSWLMRTYVDASYANRGHTDGGEVDGR